MLHPLFQKNSANLFYHLYRIIPKRRTLSDYSAWNVFAVVLYANALQHSERTEKQSHCKQRIFPIIIKIILSPLCAPTFMVFSQHWRCSWKTFSISTLHQNAFLLFYKIHPLHQSSTFSIRIYTIQF